MAVILTGFVSKTGLKPAPSDSVGNGAETKNYMS